MASKTQNRMDGLVEEFVACFEQFDEMIAFEQTDPVARELASGEADGYGRRTWRPARRNRSRAAQSGLRQTAGKISETLRTTRVDVPMGGTRFGHISTGCEPAGTGREQSLSEMSRDAGLWESLLSAGFIRFGKGHDMD
jgi:hypothetical protein